MQTIKGEKKQNIDLSSFKAISSPSPVLRNQANKLKVREYISWSISFGVIFFLTGLLKFLNVGVTMDPVTKTLFYLSIVGLICSIYKIISVPRANIRHESSRFHNLN
jgi:hypothetical protein